MIKWITIIGLLFTFTGLLFNFLPAFPSLDGRVLTSITDYFGIMVQYGSGILGFFVDNWVLSLALAMVIFIYTAEPIYYFIRWILSKLPIKFSI